MTVADVDWAHFAPAFTSRRPSPLLAGLAEARQALAEAEAPASETAGPGIQERLSGLPAADRRSALLELVRDCAIAVLGLRDARSVGAQQPFRDLGFDSLTAVELRNGLNAGTGLRLPTTLVFDYPTPATLADHLCESLFPEADAQPPGEGDQAAVRETLARIPFARLQESGLLSALLALAGPADAGDPAPGGEAGAASGADDIHAMEIDDLVELALGGLDG